MLDYLRGVWAARHFWWHLSMSDLRLRWRRSFLGVFWSIVQPLGLTLLISFVFSRIFSQSLGDYAPYILSGMIVWEYVAGCTVGGSLAFAQADAYIKQTKHPLAIYTLRNVVSGLVVLSLASIALVAWVLVVRPGNFGLPWLAALTVFPIVASVAWPLATIMAYVGTRFRDLPYALGLVLQAMWFVSPIYFEDSVFQRGGLHGFVDYNPIYHLLQIVRAPILHGAWPSPVDYVWCLGTAIFLAVLAWAIGSRAEPRVIYYLSKNRSSEL